MFISQLTRASDIFFFLFLCLDALELNVREISSAILPLREEFIFYLRAETGMKHCLFGSGHTDRMHFIVLHDFFDQFAIQGLP